MILDLYLLIIHCVLISGLNTTALSNGDSVEDRKAGVFFTRQLGNVTEKVAGKNLRLKCEAVFISSLKSNSTDALKNLKVYWLRDNVPVTSNKDRIVVKKNIVNDSVHSSMKISNVVVEDSAIYTCVIGNALHEVKSSTRVIVVDDANEKKVELPTYEPLYPKSTGVPKIDVMPEVISVVKKNDVLEPICQLYNGSTCLKFFEGQFVYIPYTQSQSILEEKLSVAFKVIKYSNEVSSNCEEYALPSLCYSTFPVCRYPNETNQRFFKEMAIIDRSKASDEDSDLLVHFENLPPSGLPPHLKPERSTRSISNFNVFSRDSISLRRVCKQDCEILENELCQKEYAIAKRHPHIGGQLTLEECVNLPDNEPDCLELGLEKETGTDEDCFWESGVNYRGKVNVTALGFSCIKWSHQLRIKLNTYPELAGGHNYCRNPGGKRTQPWCYAERETLDPQICDIPKCSRRIWLYIIVTIASVCVLFILLTVCICRRQKPKDGTTTIRNINLPNADKNIYGNSRLNSPIELNDLSSNQNSIPPPPGRSPRPIGQIRVPQYTLSQVKFIEELGEGAFGKVYKGELRRGSENVFVAVKALKENASAKTQADFRREIDLISDLRHDNIVCIVGVALREEPLCMLFEFMARGDLHEFLMGRAPPGGCGLPPLRLLTIAHHIASGMEYLAGHHYVHRDLAARNCLVADNFIVKISDFGLSRDIYSSDYYRVQSKSLLPVRWMPPESILYGKFTTESDIWSFGVVLWEIYSYGLQPYYGYSNQEVISMVRGGELLGCPVGCPAPVYNLMRDCWRQQPPRRPHFEQINNGLANWINAGGCNGESTSGISDSSATLSMAECSNSIIGNSSRSVRQPNADRRERMPLLDSSSGSVKKFSSSECGDSLPRLHSSKKGSCGSLLDAQGLDRSNSKSSTVIRLE